MTDSNHSRVSLVILNKNDAAGLKVVYPRIPLSRIDEILVIDGQSVDDSVEYCRARGVRVIVQEKLGRGEAFRIAAREIRGDYVIFLSSDGNEDPADIPQFIRLLDDGNDLVIASRLARGGKNKDDGRFFPLRKWMLQLFTLVINLRWHGHITDVWNGYRAFKTAKLRNLPSTTDGHVIELEQSIHALQLGYRIAEFPTNEGDRVQGNTRNPLIKTGVGLVNTTLKEMFTFGFLGCCILVNFSLLGIINTADII
jgi:glycosyltransferase involved in cell wall biosynthesis